MRIRAEFTFLRRIRLEFTFNRNVDCHNVIQTHPRALLLSLPRFAVPCLRPCCCTRPTHSHACSCSAGWLLCSSSRTGSWARARPTDPHTAFSSRALRAATGVRARTQQSRRSTRHRGSSSRLQPMGDGGWLGWEGGASGFVLHLSCVLYYTQPLLFLPLVPLLLLLPLPLLLLRPLPVLFLLPLPL